MRPLIRLLAPVLGFGWLAAGVLADAPTGSVIFIHPDGTGLGHWNAARQVAVGPDGMLEWDRLERLAAYRPHQRNWLSTTSHAGGTVHAYGKKVHYDSFGYDRDQPLSALSGKPLTIMEEALRAGIRCGIINTGHIGEPGTAVFLARTLDRGAVTDIAAQIFASGADVIFCGGEVFLLPEGQTGRHGQPGRRTDGRNLLEEAAAAGYTLVFTRSELLALPADTRRVIGIFAALNTYNDQSEAALRAAGLPLYDPAAPTFAEMVAVALRVLGADPERPFFLVAEEEGTDNFSNVMNASGMLEATIAADEAIGAARCFMQQQPDRRVLLLVGSDSDAGHPTLVAPRGWTEPVELPPVTDSGARLHGATGQGGPPFWSQPDRFGTRHPFGIAWPASGDYPGSVVTRAHGFRSELLGTTVDNTGIYPIMYQVLFGKPPAPSAE